jgi:O-antigen ligase
MSVNTRKDRTVRILRAFQVYYLAFVCFLVAFGELFPGSDFCVGRKVENLLALLAVPLIVAVVLIALERHLRLRLTWRECLLAAFLVFTALGLLYSPHPHTVRKGLMQVVAAALLYLLLLHAVRSGLHFRIFCGAFIAGAVMTTAVGIANYLSAGTAGTDTWGHYNTFGAFLHMPIALCLALTVFYLNRWRVLAVVLPVLAFLLLGTYVSHSRGTWLGCAVIVVLMGALCGKRGLAVAGVITVLGLTALLVSPPEALRQRGISGLVSMNDPAIHGRRRLIWPVAAQLVRERPLLGYGLNTYRKVYQSRHGIERPRYSEIEDGEERIRAQQHYLHRMNGNVHPHNELLQAWISLGVAGVLFYVAAFVMVLLTYIGLRRMKLEGFPAAVGAGVFAWYAGHTVHGLFDCFFFSGHAFAAAAVMFALMFGTYYHQKRKKEAPETAPHQSA